MTIKFGRIRIQRLNSTLNSNFEFDFFNRIPNYFESNSKFVRPYFKVISPEKTQDWLKDQISLLEKYAKNILKLQSTLCTYNDYPKYPKIVAIVDRWSLFRGAFMLSRQTMGQ